MVYVKMAVRLVGYFVSRLAAELGQVMLRWLNVTPVAS